MRISGMWRVWFKLFSKRRLWFVLGGVLVFVTAVTFCSVSAAGPLLTVAQPPQIADVIIVLGGGAKQRAVKAIELYRQGFAERILVVGRNEEQLLGKQLRQAGIPDTAISYEPQSRSTYENARFSLPYLQRWNVGSILLVTSWFHSRRATAVFRSVAGMPEVITVPAGKSSIGQVIGDSRVLLQVFKEYLKIGGYWVRYGIVPI